MKRIIITLISLLCALLLTSVIFCACDINDGDDDRKKDEDTTEAVTDEQTDTSAQQTTAETTEKATETTEEATETTEEATETTEEATETTEKVTETTEEATEEKVEGYKVTVVDEEGNPIAGVYVQFCKGDICMAPYATDENGVIVYNYDDDDYTVKAFDFTDFIYESVEPEYTLQKGEKELTIVMKKLAD